MKKILLGLIGLLFAMPAVADTSGAISSVTVAGLVAQNGTPTPTTPIDIVSNNGVLKASKNLFDYNQTMVTGPSSWDRTKPTYAALNIAGWDVGQNIITDGTRWNQRCYAWLTPCKSGDTFYIQAYGDNPGSNTRYFYAFMDADGVVLAKDGYSLASAIVAPANTAYCAFEYSTKETTGIEQWFISMDPQLPTTYHPYGEVYVEGEVETITDSANHTATVATLLGVGDYRDTQNINTGAITRNIGVKVLDGTEDWVASATSDVYILPITGSLRPSANLSLTSTHFIGTVKINTDMPDNSIKMTTYSGTPNDGAVYLKMVNASSLSGFKQYLAAQYANGTPVIIVYPLATETTESVAGQTMTTAPVNNRTGGVTGMTITTLLSSGASVVTTIAADAIKIATTAYNSARFSPVVTELNDTIATIRSVVTNTINQTKAIADLQATKQTRPDAECPAGKKCLLVEDDAGQPHWYEIIENAD